MLSTPLPRQVDVRKLIAAGAEISAREPLQNFARLAPMLAKDDWALAKDDGALAKDDESNASVGGDVEVKLHFHIDESGSKRIDGEVRAEVMVQCQRCLQPMPLPIDSTFAVAVVWSDDEAGRLPKYLEPYIVGDEPQDIRDLIEDELILCVPYASYHEQQDCKVDFHPAIDATLEIKSQTETKPNPFKVLEQLKLGKKK